MSRKCCIFILILLLIGIEAHNRIIIKERSGERQESWTAVCPEAASLFEVIVKYPNANVLKVQNCKDLYLSETNTLQKDLNVEFLYIGEVEMGTIPDHAFAWVPNLKALYLKDNRIQNLSTNSFGGLTNLEVLYLGENEIETLPAGVFDDLKSLERITMKSNRLTALSADVFKQNKKLKMINLNENQITQLDRKVFFQFRNLESLSISQNPITELYTNSVRFLSLVDCAVQRLVISGSVEHLVAANNPLKEFRISDWGTTKIINLSNCSMSDFDDLKEATKLEKLNISSNPVDFTTIDADFFSQTKYLKSLHLQNTGLTKLNDNHFDHLESLEILDLSHNQLIDFPITSIKTKAKLSELNLENNGFITLDWDGFADANLMGRNSKLHLANNPWNCVNILKIIEFANKNDHITVTREDFFQNQLEICNSY